MNKEHERRIRLSLRSGANREYLLNIGSLMERSGKGGRNFEFTSEAELKTPYKDLMTVKGSTSYTMDKSTKGNLLLSFYKMKPVTFTCKLSCFKLSL